MTTQYATSTNSRTKRTLTVQMDCGPVVTDVWEPVTPIGADPILLIHGWGGTGNYWQKTAFALSQTVQVIVPDLPGTGRSQPLRTTHNMYDQVEVLICLLDKLQLNRVQIVGHSMGGAMAVLLSAKQPERVSRLVLTSLTFFMTTEQIEFYQKLMRMFRVTMKFRPDWLASVPGAARMMATHYFYRVPRDRQVLRRGLLDFLQLDEATAIACADNATDAAIAEAGAHIQAPTLLVASRQDQMMPLENVDFTINRIPQCDVRWIEECGHLPMVEKPEAYLAILCDFLNV